MLGYLPGIGINRLVLNTSVVSTAATGVGTTSFTANWNTYPGAQYYLLDVSTSPTFNTFIYQAQVVFAPTTSYVVIGLTENTTYYYRVIASTDTYVDPDYSAFYNRVTAAGGTLSATEQTATHQLVLDLKANSLWTAMKAIYPMIGSSAASCAQNLKSSSFTGTFSSGWTFASTGVTPNGTSAYMDTNFIPSANLSASSQATSFYSRSNIRNGTVNDNVDLGALGNGICTITASLIDNAIWGFVRYGTTQDVRITTANRYDGFFVGSRTSATSLKLWRSNSLLGTSTITDSGITTFSIYLGAENNSIPAHSFTNRQYAFAHIGDGLNDTQAAAFYTNVQNFNTTLSRQI